VSSKVLGYNTEYMLNPTRGAIAVLSEQIVPSAACAVCEVCCRFPEADSPLRPYFTHDEIQAAISAGISPQAFPDHAGSKITLVPSGDGYQCPAFDSATRECRIYASRPLDCQLYPVAVMWDATQQNVVMGWDTKCPFIMQNLESPESRAYVNRTAERLESESMVRVFAKNPDLIGAFQNDVIVLKRLTRMTERLHASPSAVSATTCALRPLSLDDRERFETLMYAHLHRGDTLAAYSFPYHYIWRDLFSYGWAELEGHYCLFASNETGMFLALPPVGPDPTGPSMTEAFQILVQHNRIAAASRIENVSEVMVESCRAQGYVVTPTEGDYLYRGEDLVTLKGDRYKSQRASYNQCAKYSPSIRAYEDGHRSACLKLFDQWRAKMKPGATEYARYMAEDAASAHGRALMHARELGLMGLVAYVGDKLVGYTFGYPLNSSVFCILLEITDRNIPGLSAYLFREFCRQLGDYECINTMGDSDLEGLRRTKQNYHPLRVIFNYTVRPVQGSVSGAA
jgi:uncharacterized protein